MKKKLSVFLLSLLMTIGISGVNTYCFFIFGQEREPNSLKKYRKYSTVK